MIEEIIADRIEGIFEQKQLGHISPDHAREQLIKQLMYLTQAQRQACERNVTNRLSISLKFNEDELRVLIAILQVEILSAEVKP